MLIARSRCDPRHSACDLGSAEFYCAVVAFEQQAGCRLVLTSRPRVPLHWRNMKRPAGFSWYAARARQPVV